MKNVLHKKSLLMRVGTKECNGRFRRKENAINETKQGAVITMVRHKEKTAYKGFKAYYRYAPSITKKRNKDIPKSIRKVL